MTKYYPLCFCCGEEVMSFSYIRGNKYKCKACRLNEYLSDSERREIIDHEKKEKKLAVAMERIKKQPGRFADYSVALPIIERALHKDGWFDSTEEIMVALELVRKGIKTRHQVEFGRYRADFVLPDEKIVLEVDGRVFHNKNTVEKENIRDALISLSLGPEWEVVRVTDDLINENIKRLVPAIRKIREKRRLLRRDNQGSLPQWYTNRKI